MASETGALYSPELAALNSSLSASGVQNVRILSAEISVSYASDEWTGATTLIANNRDHTINSQFVASDPRRGGSSNITYLVDQSDGSALSFGSVNPRTIVTLTNAVTELQIDASMAFWGLQPSCGPPGVIKVADTGADPDLIDNLVLGGPLGTPFADITHAGWLPGAFFNAIAPNGGNFILGVTFTFIFVDAAGNPTDIDRNGRFDAAFREIYYNRGFGWGADLSLPDLNVDIQSVAIHEAGHAYGLGHFGKVFLDNKGNFQYAPKAIMNAVYIEPFREMTGTDMGSFCQIWARAN